MMKEMDKKMGFCFDLDGTLINSTDIGDKVEKEVIKKFNIQINEKLEKEIDELIYEIVQGENRKKLGRKIMSVIFKKLGLNFFQRIKALALAGKIFKEEVKKIKLFEGVESLFDFLDVNEYPYTIATTSSSKEVDDRLKKFPNFYKKFNGKLITRSSVKYLKPHPESIEKASRIMGVPLNRCVMIGDMHTDINMGKAVESITIGVLTGLFSREKFLLMNPDFIIDSVSEIPEIIDQIKNKVYNN